jgi:hypothetical protein
MGGLVGRRVAMEGDGWLRREMVPKEEMGG